MRRSSLIVLAAVAVAAVASPAAAQGSRSFASAARPAARAVPDAVVARAQALSQRAGERWNAYDLSGARRDYQQAADLLRARGVYAGPTLEALAHVTFALEAPERAAKVLVEAAAEAAEYGDLALQVSALFEASVLYSEAGDTMQAKALLGRVERLLSSPYVPQDVKSRIERRMSA